MEILPRSNQNPPNPNQTPQVYGNPSHSQPKSYTDPWIHGNPSQIQPKSVKSSNPRIEGNPPQIQLKFVKSFKSFKIHRSMEILPRFNQNPTRN